MRWLDKERSARLLQEWKNEKEVVFEESFSTQFIDEQHKIISRLLQNNNAYLSINNYLKVLRNGEEKFKDLIACLESASHHIHLEYYIIEDDPLVLSIMAILKKKAQNGVEVRIVYDDVGSSGLKNRFINDLKKSGIEIYPFMKVRFPGLHAFTCAVHGTHRTCPYIICTCDKYVCGTCTCNKYVCGHDLAFAF